MFIPSQAINHTKQLQFVRRQQEEKEAKAKEELDKAMKEKKRKRQEQWDVSRGGSMRELLSCHNLVLLRLELLLVSVCLLANLVSYAKQVHVNQKHAIKSKQLTNKRACQTEAIKYRHTNRQDPMRCASGGYA